MIHGRVCGVSRNPNHEANVCRVQGGFVEAYHFDRCHHGAACDPQGDLSVLSLVWNHSVRQEFDFKDAFQAVTDACNLRWDVLNDLSNDMLGPVYVPTRIEPCRTSLSSGIHRHRGLCVRFAECVEIFVGGEDDLNMTNISFQHRWLQQWEDKPWSGGRTVRESHPEWFDPTGLQRGISQFFPFGTSLSFTLSPNTSDYQAPLSSEAVLSRFSVSNCLPSYCTLTDFDSRDSQAPLSCQAVSSRLPCHSHQLHDSDCDVGSLMQLGAPISVSCKQDDHPPEGAAVIDAISQGHTPGAYEQDEYDDTENILESDEPGSSSSSDETLPLVQAPPLQNSRQDAILFHLQDDPIRVFLEWNSHENKMVEIAFHFAVAREELVDAYEIVTPLRGIPNGVVPIIVHLMPDTAIGANAKLVLFDIELHGHRFEPHFRLGPETHRFVAPVPASTDRAGFLVTADVDRYCSRERDRCIVYHNNRWWPDFDVLARPIAQGDVVRIVVPPSERFACPTSQIVEWTQRNFPDEDILDMIANDDVVDGLSPSLLGENEVRELATPNIVHEPDDMHSLVQSPVHKEQSPWNISSNPNESSSSHSDPFDWQINLACIVQRRCEIGALDVDQFFSVYTWFLDHEKAVLCTAPKIAHTTDDPSVWEEDVAYPWRFHIDPGMKNFFAVVLPSPPVSDVETHLAHIIITQRPSQMNSVLISLEFHHATLPIVYVRFAAMLESSASIDHIVNVAPLLKNVPSSCIRLLNPVSPDRNFVIRDGMCIRIEITPQCELSDSSDTSVLMQSSHSVRKNVSVTMITEQTKGICTCSIMDTLLAAVNAANAAVDNQLPPIEPDSIEAQPEGIRDLWERLVDQQVGSSTDATRQHRVESWFVDHVGRHNRCLQSRIVHLSDDFLTWQSTLAEAWHDRFDGPRDFELSLVHPESEDKPAGTFAQVIITQHASHVFRSVLLSVYDSDPELERSPYTFALVLVRQIDLSSLLNTLHLDSECPPSNVRNHCSLWYGSVPIIPTQRLMLHNGYAFRLSVSRGIYVDVCSLLAMDDRQLRQTIQSSLTCDVFTRPPEPRFTRTTGDVNRSLMAGPDPDSRPIWVNELHHRFTQCFSLVGDDLVPMAYVVTWYVNNENRHYCASPSVVRIDSESFMWRTHIIMAWRDHILRATPMDFTVIEGLPPYVPEGNNLPHIVAHQGLPATLHPVLLTVSCSGHDTFPDRQILQLLQTRVAVTMIANLGLPTGHSHLPAVVQFRGDTYLPGEEVVVSAGAHLLVIVGRPHFGSSLAPAEDGFSLLQNALVLQQYGKPSHCKPAPFEEDTDLPMTFPDGNRPRELRPMHDSDLSWMDDLSSAVRIFGELDVWNEFTSIFVTTWFIHHDQAPTCRRPRIVRITGEVITWIDDIRTAWIDELDQQLPFTIKVVSPRPPSLRQQGRTLHLIIEQARPPQMAAVVITALFLWATWTRVLSKGHSPFQIT